MSKDELKIVLEQHESWIEGIGGKRADLQGVDMRWADLRWANLRWANLQSADLQGADLQGADLQGADLQSADLQGADLRWADMQGADLQGADLQGANLQGADLQGANLQGANLQGADLQGADLQGADLDYSCLPLWCGSKKMKVDKRIASQIAAHFCELDCDDADYQTARTAILEFARTSHRANDLGLLGEIVKECNDVATPIDVALRKRIAELEAFIDQLIEAGDAVINAEPMWIAEEDKWDALVKDWKERER